MTKNEPAEATVSLVLTTEELANLVTLLSISAETFHYMCEAAIKEKNQPMLEALQARVQISRIYAQKFNDALKMPEPTSKLIH